MMLQITDAILSLRSQHQDRVHQTGKSPATALH